MIIRRDAFLIFLKQNFKALKCYLHGIEVLYLWDFRYHPLYFSHCYNGHRYDTLYELLDHCIDFGLWTDGPGENGRK